MTDTNSETSCACTKNSKPETNPMGEIYCGCTKTEHEPGSNKKLQVVRAPRIYRERRPVRGEVVTIIDVTFDSSGIELTESWSRAVPKGDIHEIMVWNPLEEGGEDAAAIAFIEITQGGNIINSDEVKVDGETIGNLAGFDYNHMPNHMNIVVETKTLEVPLKLGSIIEFTPNPMLPLSDEDCC